VGGRALRHGHRRLGLLHSGPPRRRLPPAEARLGARAFAFARHTMRRIYVLLVPNNRSRTHGTQQRQGRNNEVVISEEKNSPPIDPLRFQNNHAALGPRPELLPDRFGPGRVEATLQHTLSDASQAGTSARHFPPRRQHSALDGQQTEEQQVRLASESDGLLRSARVEYYHPRVHAAGGVLSIPVERVFLRDLEARVQDEAGQRRQGRGEYLSSFTIISIRCGVHGSN
jgi:hypothetical protein